VLAVISAFVVNLTAGYILWAIQRVYLGAEYKGPHPEALSDVNLREAVIGGVIVVLCIVFGVFPWHTVLKYMDSSIDAQVNQLTAWTKYVQEAAPPAAQPDEAAPATAKVGVDDRVSLIVD
jgi:NADH-quinone oxidoreductase subunit M